MLAGGEGLWGDRGTCRVVSGRGSGLGWWVVGTLCRCGAEPLCGAVRPLPAKAGGLFVSGSGQAALSHRRRFLPRAANSRDRGRPQQGLRGAGGHRGTALLCHAWQPPIWGLGGRGWYGEWVLLKTLIPSHRAQLVQGGGLRIWSEGYLRMGHPVPLLMGLWHQDPRGEPSRHGEWAPPWAGGVWGGRRVTGCCDGAGAAMRIQLGREQASAGGSARPRAGQRGEEMARLSR